EHAGVLVVPAAGREQRLEREAEQAEHDEEADPAAQRSLPGEERRQQQYGAAELGEGPAEVAVRVQAVRLLDRVAVLHPEEPHADQEELRDHAEEIERHEVALGHGGTTTNRVHWTPSSLAVDIERLRR